MGTRETNGAPGVPRGFDARLTAYLAAAGAMGIGVAADDAEGAVIGNNTVQPFGVNGVVSVDFNTDGQTDFQIDHDRVTLPSSAVKDYLQLDKNDSNGEANPTAFDPGPGSSFQASTFAPGATTPNDQNNAAYVITGQQGSYPAALTNGTLIGPASTFDYQEGDNFQGSGKWIRANRLLDEDQTAIDQELAGRTPAQVQVPLGTQGWAGLAGNVRYLGVQMELNNSGSLNYGWIGVRITNETDATGEVVGYGYETTPSTAIPAGAVPEPGTLVIFGALGGLLLTRRFRDRPSAG